MCLTFNTSVLSLDASSFPLPTPLVPSAWEEKERICLLARESEERRGKRIRAEHPHTPADVLDQLAADARDDDLLAVALATHPNVRPQTVLQLLKRDSPDWIGSYHTPAFRAFCQNPVTPFLPLEVPGIWNTLSASLCLRLLREPDLPLLAVHAFRQNSDPIVAGEATLHIALAGPLPTGREGEQSITAFWQAACLTQSETCWEYCPDDWKIQLAKLGLIPYWAAGIGLDGDGVNNPPHLVKKFPSRRQCDYGPPPNSCDELVWEMNRTVRLLPSLAQLAALLHSCYAPHCVHWSEYGGRRFRIEWRSDDIYGCCLYRRRGRTEWMARFYDALRLPLTDDPFSSDAWKRSPLDLMHYSAQDGNRWVRWAAQTRLQAPGYQFTWHEGN